MKFLAHPVTQVLSFCIVLINGDVVGFPYIVYVYHASLQFIPYGILGADGMVLTLCSLIGHHRGVQLAGLLLMWVSLAVFFYKSLQNVSGTFTTPLCLLLLVLFVVVSAAVVTRTISKT